MNMRSWMFILSMISLVGLEGCYNHVDLSRSVDWKIDDRRPIAEPAEEIEGTWTMWDGTDKIMFYRVGQAFNLGRSFRTVGTWVGLADPREAGNVNAMDEVPNSTWFTNRHAVSRLSQDDLVRGSITGSGPDPEGLWTVISGKESLGSTPGFVIRDQRQDIYLIKFDPPMNPEMTTASEMIAPRFLHAAGYNVPEHYMVTFDPAKFDVDPNATIRGKFNVKRRMTKEDVQAILNRVPHRPDGTIRAVASKFLLGIPKGPFIYEGRRSDDPNDTIRHENRRELRGFGVLAAFLNHTDTKAGNALDMYDPEKKYLTHYLIDFSSTLGADNADAQLPRYGNEHFLDFETIGVSTIALGAYVKPWEVPLSMEFPSAGYFESVRFDPARWRPTFPNPAFYHMTLRDWYWGAKIVTSFTNEDIDGIVRTGEYTDPRVERYVAEVLKARRDKIGQYYFNVVNPLDRFTLQQSESGVQALVFENLALDRGYAPSQEATYRYTVRRHVSFGYDALLLSESVVNSPTIPLGETVLQAWADQTESARVSNQELPRGYVTIQTSYNGGEDWSEKILVYLQFDPASQQLTLLGIERETS